MIDRAPPAARAADSSRGLAFSAIIVAALTALVAAPASAVIQDAITVDVQSSAQSAVVLPGNNCQWTVTSEVTVYNLTNPAVTITYTQVWPTVSWTDSANNTSGVLTAANITVINDGGLHAGDTLTGPQFNSADVLAVHGAVRDPVRCRLRRPPGTHQDRRGHEHQRRRTVPRRRVVGSRRAARGGVRGHRARRRRPAHPAAPQAPGLRSVVSHHPRK